MEIKVPSVVMEIKNIVTVTAEDLEMTPDESGVQDFDPCQDVSYDPDYKREKQGNNRYHMPKTVAKAKRKAARIARRKNRK